MSEMREMDIAVIGMAGRFPGAASIEQFWHNICSGVESISFFSREELLAAGVDPSLLDNPNYVRAAAILDDVEHFDAGFFGFSPREAAVLDPQQRLFLECAWTALENAGYDAPGYDGYISIYAGMASSSYLMEHLYPHRNDQALLGDLFQVQMGNDKDHLATRVSYKLNLRGSAISVQTACSTSLVAIHLACQSLLNGESDLALAGGVTIQLPQQAGYLYREGMVLSPDGHCRPFDADARGTVSGSGVGVVVLKRLSQAVLDGDVIYAVVRGSAINNDGAVKIGYTAPSASGQREVITEALALADVDPATVTLVEAHGTGTELGDPIEVAALTQAFRESTSRSGYCAIGSVKSNVGHLDTAAGVCGFIKAVLALHHRVLPPSLNFKRPSPKLDLEQSPFYVNTAAVEWSAAEHPRRAGVSSFGIGGTNAHVVLEEAPAREDSGPSRSWHVLPLSARTRTALDTATDSLRDYLQQHPDVNLADVAYTLQTGRHPLSYRRMLVCQQARDVIARWQPATSQLPSSYAPDNGAPTIAFLFPGQGAQYVQMARDLYEHEPAFREQIDQCAVIVRRHLDLDLRDVLYPASALDRAEERINQTLIAQPALFSIEYALAKLWATWGIQPARMIGHSLGEYVAACLAGVFSLEDALLVVSTRARLMQQMPAGAMLSVALPEQALAALLTPGLSIAAVNGPEQCVVAGPREQIAALAEQLERQGSVIRHLHTSHAFHSAMLLPMLEPFARQLEQVRLYPPQIPYISNLTGTWITPAQATDPLYWVTHLHQTVRFGAGLEQILRDPHQILLEVGPGRTLATLATHHPGKTADQQVLTSLRHAQEHQDDLSFILQTLGQLWMAGVAVDWARLTADETRHRLALPTYPFERQRYWIDAQSAAHQERAPAPDTSRREDMAEWLYVPSWKRTVTPALPACAPAAWLVFVDEYGLGQRIADQLQATGHTVVTVQIGPGFERLERDAYMIRPLHSGDYARLFESLAADARAPQTIVHCWNIGSVDAAHPGAALQELSFYSLLYLAQAVGNHLFTEPLALITLANGLCSVTGEETLCPEKALLIGPSTVFAQEYPNKRSRWIDVVLPAPGTDALDRLGQQLLAELLTKSQETQVAYRGRHRWAQLYEPATLRAPVGAESLRQRGVYLITGGLGGIGLALAEHLARTVQARLVLVSRSPLPLREAWASWLADHDDDNRISRVIRHIQQLEQLGAEVQCAAADVADLPSLRMVVERAREQFGRIHGIIHAAGIPGETTMQRKTAETAAQVLAAKVTGTLNLARLVEDSPPDFFVLCSSLRALTGGAGQADYCAANAFLDAYALAQSHRSFDGSAAIAINWDGWQAVGMSADAVRRLNADPQQLSAGVTPQEGAQLLMWALASQVPQLIISTTPLQSQIDRENVAPTLDSAARGAAQGPKQPLHPRPDLPTPYVAPGDDIQRSLAAIWQEVFGIDRVGIDDNFFALGGDSIISLRAVARANEIGLKLTPGQIFEHQTIGALAGLVERTGSGAEQGLVSGPVPLTPIQHWFFSQEQPEPHHFNQAMLCAVPTTIEPAHLTAALQHIVLHHDALRLRFVAEVEGWSQTHAAPHDPAPVTVIDLALVPPSEQAAALEAQASAIQASLNLQRGPIVRAVLFKLGHSQPDRLLLVMHHLVVDGFSWRVVQSDLQTVLLQLAQGEPVQLPRKTTSFKAWAERLVALARSAHAKAELAAWLDRLEQQAAPLPRVTASGANLVGSLEQVSVALSEAETQRLLQDVPRRYHMQMVHVLVAALAKTLATWTNHPTVAIDMEAQGRDLPLDQLDLSRTVGWFTLLSPLLLTLDPSAGLDTLLGMVKEQLRSLPGNGLTYSVLRYLSDDAALVERLAALPRAEVVFLHMGQIDADDADSTIFRSAQEPVGPYRSLSGTRPYLLEVSSMITGGCLRIEWLYSRTIHTRSMIEQVAQEMLGTLRALLTEGHTPAASSYTPSDFPLAGLDAQKLDKIARLLGKRTTKGQSDAIG